MQTLSSLSESAKKGFNMEFSEFLKRSPTKAEKANNNTDENLKINKKILLLKNSKITTP